MGFSLKRKEEVSEGLRRIALERTELALMRHLSASDRLAAAHDVRREIKKLRAIIRLSGHRFPKESRAAEKEALRQIASLLSGVRDADARLKTLEKAVRDSRHGGRGWAVLHERLGIELAAAQSEMLKPSRVRGVRVQLAALKHRIENEWDLRPCGWSMIASGLRDSYSQGCDGLKLARKDPSPENLHEWRKAVKELWHQSSLLRRAWPPIMTALTGELKKLGAALGEHHDLAVLAEWIEKHAGNEDCDGILKELSRARARLEDGFLSAGRRIYAETPGAFCRRMHSYWKTWR